MMYKLEIISSELPFPRQRWSKKEAARTSLDIKLNIEMNSECRSQWDQSTFLEKYLK